MRKKWLLKGPSAIFAGVSVVLMCFLCMGGCIPSEKYERVVQLSEPMEAGQGFSVMTHNGSIAVTGGDVADCQVTATIIAWAESEEDAKKLAEQVEITLNRFGNNLTAKIEKPPFITGKYISVNFEVIVPEQTSLELTTHNGSVKLANITGQINAATYNGAITGEEISGSIRLHTHNGRISCRDISGQLRLKTHNGSIDVAYSEADEAVCDADIVTHNGSIKFIAPPGLSVMVDVSTHNGSINTDLPITVTGKVNKTNLKGTIGSGAGRLRLETHNGSIKIKQHGEQFSD